LLFTPVIVVTALLVVWPGWLCAAQAQLWVSEKGGGARHIMDALPMSDRVLYIQGKKVGTTNVSVFNQSMKLIREPAGTSSMVSSQILPFKITAM
jgi:hypothetical protein